MKNEELIRKFSNVVLVFKWEHNMYEFFSYLKMLLLKDV